MMRESDTNKNIKKGENNMKVYHTSNSIIVNFDFSKIGSCGGVQVGEGMYFSHSLSLCEGWSVRLGTVTFCEVEIDAKLIDAKRFFAKSPEFIAWLDAYGYRDEEGYLKESVLAEFEASEDAISVLKSRFYKEATNFDGIDDEEFDNIVVWNPKSIKRITQISA